MDYETGTYNRNKKNKRNRLANEIENRASPAHPLPGIHIYPVSGGGQRGGFDGCGKGVFDGFCALEVWVRCIAGDRQSGGSAIRWVRTGLLYVCLFGLLEAGNAAGWFFFGCCFIVERHTVICNRRV